VFLKTLKYSLFLKGVSMFFESFFKYLYGRLRVILAFSLAIVLVLTLLVISRENVDAGLGGGQSFRSASINQMNSQPDFNATLTQTFSDSDTDYTPNSRGMDVLSLDDIIALTRETSASSLILETNAEVSRVEFWLNPGRDWMWGAAEVNSVVRILINSVEVVTTQADESGEWGIEEPIEINPGDEVTVTAGAELYPVTFSVPDPIESHVDTSTDIVSGQIGGRSEDLVEVHGWWEQGYAETSTDIDGNFSIDYYTDLVVDIPPGAEGYIRFSDWINGDETEIIYHQYFRSLDLILNINYSHDWIEGGYAPGYDVKLSVLESDNSTLKATATITTGEIQGWNGGTGFSTNYQDPNHPWAWDLEHPNIQPYDWVLGEVDVNGTKYYAEVQIGWFDGEVNLDSDSFTGSVYAPADYPLTPIEVWCDPWGAPGGVESKQAFVLPDGVDTFTCDWSGEWDIQLNQDLGIRYKDPYEGHWIYAVFQGYPDVPILIVHYDHDWIEGPYKANHTVYIEVKDSEGILKAHTTLDTQVFDDWGGRSGFATHREGTLWIPNHPDIQPGDTIYAEVDAGAYSSQLIVGAITANVDLVTDIVTGTVAADWLLDEPYNVAEVTVSCELWEENGRSVQTTVVPDGVDEYVCDFYDDFDLIPGSNLMVIYFEPDGHQVIGDFHPPAPHLRIEKWLESGSPGAGGVAELYIQYANHGEMNAEDVVITDTMIGLTYLSDTSGITPTGSGSEVSWNFGTVEPGDWISFRLFAVVTADAGEDISNLAEISTSNPYDMGDEWEKRGEWTGMVEENSADLSPWINPWTWNPAPGENLVYTVGVCNNGGTGSTPLTLTINLDPMLTFTGDWWTWEPGWVDAGQGAHQLVLTRPTMPGWRCHEVYVKVTLDGGATPGDELNSWAVVAASNDTNPENDEAWVTHHVGEPYTDLSIGLGWHWGILTPGGEYRYGIYFRNDGNTAVAGPIEITATLPAGTNFLGWDKWGWASIGDSPNIVGQTVTWAIDDLDPGYEGTIEVWLEIDPATGPGTVLEHLAYIDVQIGEGNTENNTSTMTETVYDHGPNLRLRKWGDWHGHGEGHYAWYQLQVENIGDETVQSVEITDVYAADMVLEGDVQVGFWEGWNWYDVPEQNTFVVNLDRLEPGWNVGIHYDMRIPEEIQLEPGMPFTNTAAVTPVDGDIYPADNSVALELISTHGPAPHLRIEKYFIGDGSPGVGSNAAFWVQYINEGEVAAENVTITDTLVGMTFLRDSSDFTAAVEPGGQAVSWELGTVEPGDWIGFVVFAEVTVQVGDPVSNTVLIETINPYDRGEPWEKTATWEGTVAENDTYLNVHKWPWTWSPAPDEDFLYGVRVCNHGTTSSSDVSLIDTLPSNTSFVNWWSWDSGWYEVSVGSGSVELGHTVISPNTCSEVYIRVHVADTALPGDWIYNSAVISGGNDLSMDDNEAEVWHQVGEPNTEVSIGVGWHSGVLTPGGLYRYGIYFVNQGNTAVSSPIAITATLPEGTQLVYWEKWGWVSVGEDPVIDGQTVTWEISGLDPGYDGTIEVWLEIDPTTEPGTELVHTAEIEVQAGEENTDNNTSTLTEWVYDHGPNLRLHKDGGWHDEGHSAWFNLQVENIGDETVEPVVITDAYAEEMVLAGDVYSGYWEGWTWEDHPDEDYLVVNLDRLEPGWSVGINYVMSIPGEITPGMVFENTASVPTGGDINPVDNSVSFKLNYQSLQGDSQLTSARTKCSAFAAGEASDVERLFYKVKTDRRTEVESIKSIAPSTFQYYVKVLLPAKASTIVITQEKMEGWPTMGASVTLYDQNCAKLSPLAAKVTIVDGNITIDFAAETAERVIYIAVNYTTKPIIGQVVTKPYPVVEYLFKAALKGEEPFTYDSLELIYAP
jgi:uncharacterized repeat protein (TIGR01451 family)